ncbi:hypothetical protein [Coleofasciculus sp. H7-2]|uniref:hypothetical protein n=1 Tax=Coleofasciculus sp. H7-2 TaxID=3351545 RepID=UPI00366F4ECC
MNAHRVETTLTEDGRLTLNNLPFCAGDSVEVIVVVRTAPSAKQNIYPLRGMPIRYNNPTEPVAEEDWSASG